MPPALPRTGQRFLRRFRREAGSAFADIALTEGNDVTLRTLSTPIRSMGPNRKGQAPFNPMQPERSRHPHSSYRVCASRNDL